MHGVAILCSNWTTCAWGRNDMTLKGQVNFFFKVKICWQKKKGRIIKYNCFVAHFIELRKQRVRAAPGKINIIHTVLVSFLYLPFDMNRKFSCNIQFVLFSQRLWRRISMWLDRWSGENVFRTLKPPSLSAYTITRLSLLMFTFAKNTKTKTKTVCTCQNHLMYMRPGIALLHEDQFL